MDIARKTSRPKREYRTHLFQLGLLLVAAAFAALTLLVQSNPTLPIDLPVTLALQSIDSRVFAGLMQAVSWPGFAPQVYGIVAVLAVLIYISGFRWETVAALFASIVSPAINILVKELIRRPRPTDDLVDVFRLLDSYSFPSGHVMFYIGYFGFLWFLAYTLLKRSWLRTSLLTLLGILIALVGMSRVYLGQHWASDVVGAYLLGTLVLFVVLGFYRWGRQRYFARRSAAAEE